MGEGKVKRAEIKHYETQLAKFLLGRVDGAEMVRLWKSRHRNVEVRGPRLGHPIAGAM